MRPLFEYLQNQPFNNYIDGHIHLFDGKNQPIQPTGKCVGFADILFKHQNIYKGAKLIQLYKDYIKNYDTSNIYLLATGLTAEDVINLYKAMPDKIAGFGELKCYDKYGSEEVVDISFKRLDWVRKICDFNADLRLPIYLHYTLTDPRYFQRFSRFLNEYPNIPIVLCHCGMDIRQKDTKYDWEWTFFKVLELLKTYRNLWIDISYTAYDFFAMNPGKITSLPMDRIIVGSDRSPLNPTSIRFMDDWVMKWSDENILSLFDN